MTNTTGGSLKPDEPSQNITGSSLSVKREMCSEFASNDITLTDANDSGVPESMTLVLQD